MEKILVTIREKDRKRGKFLIFEKKIDVEKDNALILQNLFSLSDEWGVAIFRKKFPKFFPKRHKRTEPLDKTRWLVKFGDLTPAKKKKAIEAFMPRYDAAVDQWKKEKEEKTFQEAAIVYHIIFNGQGSNYKYRDGRVNLDIKDPKSFGALDVFSEVLDDKLDAMRENERIFDRQLAMKQCLECMSLEELDLFAVTLFREQYGLPDAYGLAGHEEIGRYDESVMLYWMEDWHDAYETWSTEDKFSEGFVSWKITYNFPWKL